MGLGHVISTIRNRAEPEKIWEGLFLVDTGATDCLVPRQHLEAIALEPEGELADGRGVRTSITVDRIEFMSDVVGATIKIGDGVTEPLLGDTTFESTGIEVDLRNQELRRMPIVRLSSSRH